jgi:hypothetical protein
MNNNHQKVFPGQGDNIQPLGMYHSVEYTEEGKLLFYRKDDTIGPALTLWPEQVKLLLDFMKRNEENICER